MKQIYRLMRTILSNKGLIMNLARNDFRARYSASFLGAVWAFVQPLITILVFWFVFQMGFKSAPVDNIPYILWFIPAYVPWIYFSDILTSCAGCMQEYSYLVKKVRFHIEILPEENWSSCCQNSVSGICPHIFCNVHLCNVCGLPDSVFCLLSAGGLLYVCFDGIRFFPGNAGFRDRRPF